MGELDGKNCIITGSSSGIGAATAIVMAKHGANVAVIFRKSIELAEKVAEQIQKLDRKSLVIQADVTQKDQVCRMVETVLNEWESIEVLVNNVGHAYYRRINELEPEDWYLSLDENLTSQVYCIQAVLPSMLERHYGRIITLSSISAQRGSPSGDVSYSACKAGILALTKTLARNHALDGITVNSVLPGIIDAGLTMNMSSERRSQVEKAVPMGRLGRAEEVGEVIAFLASDRASYITGQSIPVNGGLYM
jgi:3-oxoacyl-[acyl-carrier protein] reductase